MLNIEYFLIGLISLIGLVFFIIHGLLKRNFKKIIKYSIGFTIILIIAWGIAFFGKPLDMQIEEAWEFIYHLNPLYELAERGAWVYYICLVGIMLGILGIAFVIINKIMKSRREKERLRYW